MSQQIPGKRKPPVAIPNGVWLNGKKAKYKIDGRLGEDDTGATGTVLRASDESGRLVAIKLYVPQEVANQIEDATGSNEGLFAQDLLPVSATHFMEKEKRALTALSHDGVVRWIDSGSLQSERSWFVHAAQNLPSIPFNVLELIDGPSLQDWLKTGQTWPAVLEMVQKLCAALQHIHDQGFLHGDIKLNNFRLRLEGSPVLMDFGRAVFFDDDPGKLRRFDVPAARISSRSKHYKALSFAQCNPGVPGTYREQFFPWFDLMCLAEMLLEAKIHETPGLPSNVKAILSSILENVVVDTPSVARTAAAFEYLVCKSELPEVVSFLVAGRVERTMPLATSLVPIRAPADSIIDVPEFARLHEVRQLGLVELVYRGATHTRFYHSVATYDAMQQFMASLLAKRDPIFSRIWTPKLGQLALCTALLHDLHHFHFRHVFEEGLLLQDKEAAREFKEDLFVSLCDGIRPDHVFEDRGETISRVLADVGLSPIDVLAVLRGRYDPAWRTRFPSHWLRSHPDSDSSHPFSDDSLKVLHSFIDSGVDVDKVAYVTDDAFFAGTTYGRAVDRQMLLKYACIGRDSTGSPHLAYEEQAVPAIESLLLARHWAFKTMYWHHTHRALMAMILEVVNGLFTSLDEMKTFVLSSLYTSQSEFLGLLDKEFTKRKVEGGRHSILFGLPFSRAILYKRLCSLRPYPPDRPEARIGERLKEWLSDPDKKNDRKATLADALSAVLHPLLKSDGEGIVTLSATDILVDSPGRKIDNPGNSFIWSAGQLKQIAEWSAPVAGLGDQFDKLSKYVRIFVNTERLRDWNTMRRDEYGGRILQCLQDVVPE
jgi:HD superfamily phosphohydrolase